MGAAAARKRSRHTMESRSSLRALQPLAALNESPMALRTASAICNRAAVGGGLVAIDADGGKAHRVGQRPRGLELL